MTRNLQKAALGLLLTVAALAPAAAHAAASAAKPTILLVHGAFAESLGWEAVVQRLLADGYPVVSAANPLRGLRSDSAYIASLVDTIPGSVVMVGHSYGGAVISNAAEGKKNVKGLVFVAAFAPESGEAIGELQEKLPGSTLGTALTPPVNLPDGRKDVYVQQARYREQIAADVPARKAAVLASQPDKVARLIKEAAAGETR